MQLELATVLHCDGTTCHPSLLDRDHCFDAQHSAPMRTQSILARPDQLVAVDMAACHPLIVYRWADIRAEPAQKKLSKSW